MAGGHAVIAEAQRLVQKQTELDRPVADYTRIRRATGLINPHERLLHQPPELGLPRKDVKIDAELCGRAHGVGNFAVRVCVQAHDRAADRIARPPQKRGGHGAVHAAGHGGKNFFHGASSVVLVSASSVQLSRYSAITRSSPRHIGRVGQLSARSQASPVFMHSTGASEPSVRLRISRAV